MSASKFLEKLLDGVAVEWRALGEVTNVLRGKRLTKSELTAGAEFPVYHGGLEPLGHYVNSNRPANTVMIINVGASAGTVGYSFADFWSSDGCYCIEHSKLLNNRFLYFALIGHQSLLRSRVRVAGIPTLDAIVVEKLEIPIPCPDNPKKSLEIQAEIVRILDAFTELTTEVIAKLRAELVGRQKQHDHYRDSLFKFEDGAVEWRELGELFPFIRNGFVGTVTPYYTDASNGVRYLQGTNIQKGAINDNKRYYITRDFHEKLSRTKLQSTDILIVQSGHVGESAVVGENYANCNCHALIVMSNGGQCNSKFVNYFFQTTEGKNRLSKITTGETVKHILASKIKKMAIPLPSIETQARIVTILDKFDALTNSLTESLPREIELRQKQYEYYRDRLLSFPKPEEAGA